MKMFHRRRSLPMRLLDAAAAGAGKMTRRLRHRWLGDRPGPRGPGRPRPL